MRMLGVGALAGALVAGGGLGMAMAWWLHRRTRLSAWNLYLLAPVAALAWGLALAARSVAVALAAAAMLGCALVAAARARRLRLAALGAGGELREFEHSRRMVWTAVGRAARRERAQDRARGERTRILGQGEL